MNKQKIPNYSLSKIKNKNGQMKIQQMAIMLIAITLFFLLVLLFYIKFQSASLKDTVIELNRAQAVGLVSKISASPEFNFESSSRGIDLDKIMILKGKTEYKDFWNIDGMIIEKLYPPGEKIECTKSNYPNCSQILLFTDGKGEFTHSYVSLCRKDISEGIIYNHCDLAIIKLGVKQLDDE